MKLGLGTAQLGFDYGIANQTGMPDTAEAFEMLRLAYEAGIDTFDTAAAYGGSEKIIGQFIKQNRLQKKIKIVSKGRLASGCADFYNTLKNLNIEYIDYYLLHSANDLYNYEDQFKEHIKEGTIKKFGVSVYTSEDIKRCFEFEDVSVIQIPFNLLDNRLIKSGMLEEMKDRGLEVHARSIYLQGLLLMDTDDIPYNLREVKGYIDTFDQLARDYGLTRKQLLFLYVRDNEYIDKMFVGCENVRQLNENMQMYNKKAHINPKEKFMYVPEKILNPSMWGG